MTYEFNTAVEIDIEDLFDDMTADERRDVFDMLRNKIFEDVGDEERMELQDAPRCDPMEMAKNVMRNLSPSDMRRFLVDVFYVPSYLDDDALRKELEPIITAR